MTWQIQLSQKTSAQFYNAGDGIISYVFRRFIMVTSLTLGQSYDYPSVIDRTSKDMGKMGKD